MSLWTGKSAAHKANVTTSKSYNTQSDFRFDTKTFTELKNAQTITLAYDGFNPMPPMLMYLKPCFLDVNKSYFRQRFRHPRESGGLEFLHFSGGCEAR